MKTWARHVLTAAVMAGAVSLAWGEWPPHFEPALIVVATAAAWTFCILYALLSHGAWIRTKYGRHLMILTLGLALLGTHALAVRLVGPWDWGWLGTSQAHRELIYLMLGYQLINRCVLVVASHIRGERRREAELLVPTRPPGEEDVAPEVYANG